MEEEGFLYPLYACIHAHTHSDTGSACIDNSSFVSGQWLLVFVRIQGGSNVYHFSFCTGGITSRKPVQARWRVKQFNSLALPVEVSTLLLLFTMPSAGVL